MSLSIIVPMLNEEAGIEAALQALRAERAAAEASQYTSSRVPTTKPTPVMR